VLDRLRLFFNRPLSDADRPRLFAAAVAVIAGAAAILALLDDAGPSAAPARPAAEAPTPAPAAVALPADPTPEPAPPAEEGDVPAAQRASRAEVAAARRAARRFLAGYLPYTYGRGPVRRIGAVAPALRARLARERPRVPASERRRRPRVELLQSDGVSARRGAVTATVRDGRRRYPVRLELARTPAGWVVVDAGG
jgi:hypothetical protein